MPEFKDIARKHCKYDCAHYSNHPPSTPWGVKLPSGRVQGNTYDLVTFEPYVRIIDGN